MSEPIDLGFYASSDPPTTTQSAKGSLFGFFRGRKAQALSVLAAFTTAVGFIVATRRPQFAPDDPRCLVVADREKVVTELAHGDESLKQARDRLNLNLGDVTKTVQELIAEKKWKHLTALIVEHAHDGAYSDRTPTVRVSPQGRLHPIPESQRDASLPTHASYVYEYLGAIPAGSDALLVDIGELAPDYGRDPLPNQLPHHVFSRIAIELDRPELLVVAAWRARDAGEKCAAQDLLNAAAKHRYPEAFFTLAEFYADNEQIELARQTVDAVPNRWLAAHNERSWVTNPEDGSRYLKAALPGNAENRTRGDVIIGIEEKWLGIAEMHPSSGPLHAKDAIAVGRVLAAYDQQIASPDKEKHDGSSRRSGDVGNKAMFLINIGRPAEAFKLVRDAPKPPLEIPKGSLNKLLHVIAMAGFDLAVDPNTGRVRDAAMIDTTMALMTDFHDTESSSPWHNTLLLTTRIYAQAATRAATTGKRIETWPQFSSRTARVFDTLEVGCTANEREVAAGALRDGAALEWCEAYGLRQREGDRKPHAPTRPSGETPSGPRLPTVKTLN